jgi:hypothetical protein
VRSRLIAALGAATLVLTGCTEKAEPAALPPVKVVEQPAASAGGACILWDYAFIEEMTGVRFTVAAGDVVDETSTCVVRTERSPAPYLILSVTDGVAADAEMFTDELKPDRATTVKDLGVAGYRLVGKAAEGTGPSIEVGWLSEADQLQSLKFTLAAGADEAAVTDMTARIVSMAKTMDSTDGQDEK